MTARMVQLDSSGAVAVAGHTVPPYNYVEHKLVTRESLQ